MRILGIDPGSINTGYAIVDETGGQPQFVVADVIKLGAKHTLAARLLSLSEAFDIIYIKYKPDAVVLEQIFMGKNVDSAFKLGHARGVCLLKAQQMSAEIAEYSAREVKKGITGKGSSEKSTVQRILRMEFSITAPFSLDASDALALAAHHVRCRTVKNRLKLNGSRGNSIDSTT